MSIASSFGGTYTSTSKVRAMMTCHSTLAERKQGLTIRARVGLEDIPTSLASCPRERRLDKTKGWTTTATTTAATASYAAFIVLVWDLRILRVVVKAGSCHMRCKPETRTD